VIFHRVVLSRLAFLWSHASVRQECEGRGAWKGSPSDGQDISTSFQEFPNQETISVHKSTHERCDRSLGRGRTDEGEQEQEAGQDR
jgi:hypothetical protein